ncbi:MAG TPA: VTT domain-containing protein [Bacillales bacterium]|nr:VTT domain-containing protein [Bacillales bacterium]
MVDMLLDLLNQLGAFGLMIGLALESSSLPFPGTLIALFYGYLLQPGIAELIAIGLAGAFVYTLFSFIPYFLGYKMEGYIKRKLKHRKIERAQRSFQRFGTWSIALSRPFGVGNYISYASGVSKIKPLPFAVLTFVGVLPWLLCLLFLGQMGKVDSVRSILTGFQTYVVIGVLLIIAGGFACKFIKKKNVSAFREGKETHES